MPSYVLGLNAYHGDSSACLLRDGVLVAAVEEERFRRIKHWAGFPSQAIAFCLEKEGIQLGDVEAIALNSDPKANFFQKVRFALRRSPWSTLLDRVRNQGKRMGIEAELERAFPGKRFTGSVHRIEHHLSHLASAFYCSPFLRATTVSIDGFGDFASAAWGVGEANSITIRDRVLYPHSLGAFYQGVTQFLGFPHYGDEYKVMGLAPYGEPKYLNEMRELVKLKSNGGFEIGLQYFRFHKEKVEYTWEGGEPKVGALFGPEMAKLLGPERDPKGELTQRHKDLARSAQAMYEEAFFHLLRSQHEIDRCNAVTIAGGCGANSVANGKVRRMTPYTKVYVQSAAGDAGGAIGAAAVVAQKLSRGEHTRAARTTMPHAYWGPSFDNAAVLKVLDANQKAIEEAHCSVELIPDLEALTARTAARVADGLVIGWFQGSAEWGPRALGNRSIVCDPRRGDMKDILNSKIKRRESFRPFAPSILEEHTIDWFEEDDAVPFMMQVFQIREGQRKKVPAVCHVDGSGRLQTVSKVHNPRYHALISAYEKLTQVPMVLNTSFNENEPVVNKPEEALACFLRTKMDVLVLGDYFIERVSETKVSA
jgi:carbamoyltransferase